MPKILNITTNFPRRYTQTALKKTFLSYIQHLGAGPRVSSKLGDIFDKTHIQSRSFLFSPFSQPHDRNIKDKVDDWKTHMSLFAAGTINSALNAAQFKPTDIHEVITTTNLLTFPSMGYTTINHCNFSPQTEITNLDGLGCLGGMGTLVQAFKTAKANSKAAIVTSTCEATSIYWNGSFRHAFEKLLVNSECLFENKDRNVDNSIPEILTSVDKQRAQILNYGVIAALTGDSSSSCVIVGDQHPSIINPGIEILDSYSYFLSGTSHLVSQEFNGNGFDLHLDQSIAEIVPPALEAVTEQLLYKHNLTRADIKVLLVHPGGPKILKKTQALMGLTDNDLMLSWNVLRDVGNAVSGTVMEVMRRFMITHKCQKGDKILAMAVGPGVKFQALLLKV